jgi:hypothetical protein
MNAATLPRRTTTTTTTTTTKRQPAAAADQRTSIAALLLSEYAGMSAIEAEALPLQFIQRVGNDAAKMVARMMNEYPMQTAEPGRGALTAVLMLARALELSEAPEAVFWREVSVALLEVTA